MLVFFVVFLLGLAWKCWFFGVFLFVRASLEVLVFLFFVFFLGGGLLGLAWKCWFFCLNCQHWNLTTFIPNKV